MRKIVHYNGNYKTITIDDFSLDKYLKICSKIEVLEEEKKKLENELSEDLHIALNKIEKKKYEFSSKNYKLVASITSEYTKQVFKSSKLKEDDEALYNKYLEPSVVGEKLKLEVVKI